MSSSTPSSVETLIDSLSDVGFVLNESMSVQSMSVGSGVLRNLPRDDMIGRPWLELVRDSDKTIASEALQTALETPEQALRADLALLTGSDTDTDPTGVQPDLGPWEGHPLETVPVTEDAYTNDAGIAAVRALLEPAGKSPSWVAMDQQITEATVTAVEFDFDTKDDLRTFWIEDADGPFYAYNVALGADSANIQAGDKVSFQALEAVDYYGTPEFTEIANFEINSSGNPVRVQTLSDGTDISTLPLGTIVELWGTITNMSDCGLECWDYDYNGGIETLRLPSGYYDGDSVHWIGPVTIYFEEIQLNASDFDWARWY